MGSEGEIGRCVWYFGTKELRVVAFLLVFGHWGKELRIILSVGTGKKCREEKLELRLRCIA